MAANKTQETVADVAAYIAAVEDPTKRADAQALIDLMQRVSGEAPKLWGPSIIGFGAYHYVYDSGREGDMPLVAFSPRKPAIVFYGLSSPPGAQELLDTLGKHTTGKGCVYVKRLSDVDMGVLETLITNAVAARRA